VISTVLCQTDIDISLCANEPRIVLARFFVFQIYKSIILRNVKEFVQEFY
jgi:hypothetical protein